jgi:hypothetical protein
MSENLISSVVNSGVNQTSSYSYSATDNFYTILPQNSDSPGTNYTPEWARWNGFYRKVPELGGMIDKLSFWIVGKGFKGKDKEAFDKIRGNGKDTATIIMYNLCRMGSICGDSFAEIIRDKKGKLINIKVLNPATIKILSDPSGFITGYEQIIPNMPGAKPIGFKPEEIFHLPWNRLADEIHGISTIEKIEKIILYKNEAQDDLAKIFKRYIKPIQIVPIDEDDPVKVAAFKTKYDAAYTTTETIIVPKGVVDVENIKSISLPNNSTLDPLPWIELLQRYFVMAEGVPEVILGHGKETTEASSKILYVGFQQVIEFKQLYLEEQIKAQLDLEIEFNFPTNIIGDLISDEGKQPKPETTIKP